MKHLDGVPNYSTFTPFSLKASYTIQIPLFLFSWKHIYKKSHIAHGGDFFHLWWMHCVSESPRGNGFFLSILHTDQFNSIIHMKSIQQKLLHESEVLGEISFVFLKKKRKKKRCFRGAICPWKKVPIMPQFF